MSDNNTIPIPSGIGPPDGSNFQYAVYVIGFVAMVGLIVYFRLESRKLDLNKNEPKLEPDKSNKNNLHVEDFERFLELKTFLEASQKELRLSVANISEETEFIKRELVKVRRDSDMNTMVAKQLIDCMKDLVDTNKVMRDNFSRNGETLVKIEVTMSQLLLNQRANS